MTLGEFERQLKEWIGLDAATVGLTTVERAVQERLEACHLKSLAAYWEHVRSDDQERQELIDAVVIPETSFFRDSESFTALNRLVHEEWSRHHPDGPLRVLSIPCSTGEEPYTIAMTLTDAGFPAARLQLEAVDVSRRSLTKARQAHYGKHSFRGGDLSYRDRHFTLHGHHWELRPATRELVQFRHGNLLDPAFMPGQELYDIIFCRNLLIYFDRATQDQAITVLGRWLASDGLLFVGPSETGLLLSHDFTSVKLPLAFAFRKGRPVVATAPARPVKPLTKPLSARTVTKSHAVAKPVSAPPSAKPKAASVSTSVNQLVAARQLADQGHLLEAAEHCEAFLAQNTPTAEAYYLLGLIRDAGGTGREAAEFYRKAIYLDPRHAEALLNLALLSEREGNRAEAARLRDRARRAEENLKHA